jgi:hypothetical protein
VAHEIDRNLLSFLSSSSFGRDKVIDLIMSEYTSDSSDHDRTERLDHALEAIIFSDIDSEPAAVKGYEFMFVGSVGASLNEKSLNEKGISHVINWSSTARCNVFDTIEYHCVSGMKSKKKMFEHIDVLDEAVDLVESVRKAGGKVLSHCWYGRNRSVTLLVAYLMKYEGMSPMEATDVIRQTRPQADPWWPVLDFYSTEYLMGSGLSDKLHEPADLDWEEGTRTRHLRDV